MSKELQPLSEDPDNKAGAGSAPKTESPLVIPKQEQPVAIIPRNEVPPKQVKRCGSAHFCTGTGCGGGGNTRARTVTYTPYISCPRVAPFPAGGSRLIASDAELAAAQPASRLAASR